jgi:hypothetical protein
MTLLSYWRTLGTAGRTARRCVVPRCEVLEDRTVPSTFTVMNLNDGGPGSLRDAIAMANATPGANTIVFTPGLHGTIPLTSGELLITHSVTINGPGASRLAVSGSNASRVFEIDFNFPFTDVAINGLTITHGYAPFGGGIWNNEGDLTLSGDVLSQNVAGAGGGIESQGTLTITGCTISGNQAVGRNGGTGPFVGDASGGAIDLHGSVTISDSTFDHNQAIAGSNGNSGTSFPAPFMDYAFGGAINAQFFTTVTATNSRFSYNQAVGGNNATAVGSDLVATGGAEGGAILSEVGASAEFTGCTFDHNAAIGGNGNTGSGAVVLVGQGLGGAIVSGYDTFGPGSNLLLVNKSTFSQNEAVGGDNNAGSASGDVSVGVGGLVGTGAGAGIANYAGGTASVSNSALDQNLARGGRGNTAGGGGAILSGVGAGAGLFNGLGFFSSFYGFLFPSVVTVSNSTLSNNLAQGGDGTGAGGGICSWGAATTTVQLSSSLTGNQANGGAGGAGLGGGIFNGFVSQATIASSSVTKNQANGGSGGAGLGGGIYNDASSTLTLTASSVTRNQANGSPGIGGGIYNLGKFSFDALTVIKDNHASTSGDDIGP